MSVLSGSRLSARHLVGLIGDLDPDRPVYDALAERVRLLIADGRVPAGTRLPSERELAAQTGRSRTTIVAAYQALRDAGYLVSQQGSGSRAVLPDSGQLRGATEARAIDFARAVPPPVEGLRDIFAAVGLRMVEALDGPGFDLLGNVALRRAIAQRYTDRGLPTTPDQVMVTMGGQHAISLIAHTLLVRADIALIEAPTYPHAYDALQRAGARLVTTPVTSEGWDVEHLSDTLASARPALAYLVPDFHNPTGASMLPEDRAEVAKAASTLGTTLIIDETTADLNIDRTWDDGPFARHSRRRSPSDGSGIITVGSLSKSIWGGLRLGWIRADTAMIRRLAHARPAGDLGTPQMEQLLGEQIMAAMPGLLQRRRELLTEHRTVLTRLLEEQLPQWTIPHPEGGLSLWAQLDKPASSALTSLCEAHGLSLVAGPKFSIDGAFERYIRLPFTSPIADLEDGVALLAGAWEQLTFRDTTRTGVSRLPAVV
ncbi:PLP-dependent aminotransferase family protein [Microbacterium sp. J1-1]|uniref:MocR-like transcription factor YczR n=1 Tax=Microbacterium sp. J1-1 TaxID=2992441 RepID=UPI002114BDAC|nr:PLP-dependent aminotransferase family protein [Microbacterium sp. J1-1]UUE19377.1 PLP-dependent aminotransferase family protein [Microbacterium sp. J1-1]